MERHQNRRFSQDPRRYRAEREYIESRGTGGYRRDDYSLNEDLQDYEESYMDRAEYDEDVFERDYRAEQPYRQPYRAGRYAGSSLDIGRTGRGADYGRSGEPAFRGRERRQDFSGRGPKGYRRSDERINEEISERLTQDHNVDASEIEVKVSNGEVTLTGTIDSRRAKRIAEDIADEVSGVKDVHNQIRVSSREGGDKTGEHRKSQKDRDSSSQSMSH